MFESATSWLATAAGSEFFVGGIALGLVGAAVAAVRVVAMMAQRLFWRRFAVSVELDNRTEAFAHLMRWIAETGVLDHARRRRALRQLGRESGEMLAPAPGQYWFWRDGRLCLFSRGFLDKEKGGGQPKGPTEEVSVTVILGSMALVRGWIAEGRDLVERGDRIGPGLHILRRDWWDSLGDVPRRGIGTVIAEDDRVERLLADVARFYGAADWYAARGVPWRRGYLLYGPPGTGKSSAIRAIASELGRDIAALDVGRPDLGDDDLREGLVSTPRGALIAIEDIDAVFTGREKGEKRSGVSFSGLLNALDGVAAQEGRAVLMTTNHRERLDPALIRPGQADCHVELGLVGAAAARRFFLRFFPGEAALAGRFAESLGARRVSPAALQGWLLGHAEDPVRAAEAWGLGCDERSAVEDMAPVSAA
ncbi:MAG: AAA family ATPase [Pseudomonadota bacterium]